MSHSFLNNSSNCHTDTWNNNKSSAEALIERWVYLSKCMFLPTNRRILVYFDLICHSFKHATPQLGNAPFIMWGILRSKRPYDERPQSLDDALSLIFPDGSFDRELLLVAGNCHSAFTGYNSARRIVFIGQVKELLTFSQKGVGVQSGPLKVTFGACLTIAALKDKLTALKDSVHENDAAKANLKRIIQFLGTIGNPQVRALGTVGGNLVAARITPQKPSDLWMLFGALNAKVDWYAGRGRADQKTGVVLDTFCQAGTSSPFHGLLKSVTLPNLREQVFPASQRSRPTNHPALVSCAVTEEKIWFSGPDIVRPEFDDRKAVFFLQRGKRGLVMEEANIEEGLACAKSAELRLIATQLALKLCAWHSDCLPASSMNTLLSRRQESGTVSRQQFFVGQNQAPLTEPVIKPSSYEHAKGRTVYTQDEQVPHACLHGTYIVSPVARAAFDHLVIKREISEAAKRLCLQEEHVFVLTHYEIDSSKNVIKESSTVLPGFGEHILAPGISAYAGQPIALILHSDQLVSEELARLVQFRLEVPEFKNNLFVQRYGAPILDISTAKRERLELQSTAVIRGEGSLKGPIRDFDKAFEAAWATMSKEKDRFMVVEGKVAAGSQAHLYMETQVALCQSISPGVYRINSSTQSTKFIQKKLSAILDVPIRDVIVTCNCIGGGFGGKEPQSILVASAAAVACKYFHRPVRIMLQRELDLDVIGKRHAFEGTYKVAVAKIKIEDHDLFHDHEAGDLVAMDLKYEVDAGCSSSVSIDVVEMAVLSSENTYRVPYFRCVGTPYLTNKSSSTAARSFGVIQAMTITEAAVQHAFRSFICEKNDLKKNSEVVLDDLRKQNFYSQDKRTTPKRCQTPVKNVPGVDYLCARPKHANLAYGQKVQQVDCLERVWELATKNSFDISVEVEKFNKVNYFRKQGFAVMPLKYGVSFPDKEKNQGIASVCIYPEDGSVLIRHGGVEMGQGINVKAQQVACKELGIPFCLTKVGPHTTDGIPNAEDSGASTGVDLILPAVQSACKELKTRLSAHLAKVDGPLKQLTLITTSTSDDREPQFQFQWYDNSKPLDLRVSDVENCMDVPKRCRIFFKPDSLLHTHTDHIAQIKTTIKSTIVNVESKYFKHAEFTNFLEDNVHGSVFQNIANGTLTVKQIMEHISSGGRLAGKLFLERLVEQACAISVNISSETRGNVVHRHWLTDGLENGQTSAEVEILKMYEKKLSDTHPNIKDCLVYLGILSEYIDYLDCMKSATGKC